MAGISMRSAPALRSLFVLLAETVMLYSRVAEAARIGAKQQRELSAAMVALEQVNLWFDTALKNMTHGLSMFDKDQRLIFCNAHYAEMHGLAPEQTKPGTTLAFRSERLCTIPKLRDRN